LKKPFGAFSICADKQANCLTYRGKSKAGMKNLEIKPFLCVFSFCVELCINMLVLGIKDRGLFDESMK
jgi:hypothetical protein